MSKGRVEPLYITVKPKPLETIQELTYLGSIITDNFSLDAEINERIQEDTTTLSRLSKGVWDDMLTIKTKIKVYTACVLSTLQYAGEAWMLRA